MGLCIRKKLHIITFYLLIWRLCKSPVTQVRFSAEQFIIVFCFCLSFYQIYFLLALSSLSLCFKRLYFTRIFSKTTVPNLARRCGFPFMHCESNKFVLEAGAKSSIRNTLGQLGQSLTLKQNILYRCESKFGKFASLLCFSLVKFNIFSWN